MFKVYTFGNKKLIFLVLILLPLFFVIGLPILLAGLALVVLPSLLFGRKNLSFRRSYFENISANQSAEAPQRDSVNSEIESGVIEISDFKKIE